MTIPSLSFPRVHLLPAQCPSTPELALAPLRITTPDGFLDSQRLSKDRLETPTSLTLRKEVLRPDASPVGIGMGVGANLFLALAFWDLAMGASGLLLVGVAVFAVCTSAGLAWDLPRHARHKIASQVFQPRLKDGGRENHRRRRA